jgi:hypothetical protein
MYIKKKHLSIYELFIEVLKKQKGEPIFSKIKSICLRHKIKNEIMKKLCKTLCASLILFTLVGIFACDNEKEESNLTNNLIGKWRLETADNFWVEFTFNADLSGLREDGDGESDEFNYTFTATEFKITDGRFTGSYDYEVNNNTLIIENEVFTKL